MPPLAHPRESPLSILTCVQHLWVDAAAVIVDPEAKITGAVLQFDLNMVGTRMAEGIGQRLPANPVDLVTKQWIERFLPAFNNQAEFDWSFVRALAAKLLLNLGERNLQIQRDSARRAEPAQSTPALLDHLTHQFQRPGQNGLDSRILGQ